MTSAEVLDILGPIWHAKPETARRVLHRLDPVMEWTVTMQLRNDNPCARVRATLGRQRNVVRHMPALPYREVAGAIAAVQASRSTPAVKLAFEFLVLTAARSGEVRLATRDEMDLEAAVWTVPGTRMKSGREHRVPLSGQAVAILQAARVLRAGSPLAFPSSRGRPLSDLTLSRLLKVEGIAAVPHGFRSSFRDWAAEQTDHPREVIEAALAHTVPNKVEAAYARSTLLDRRRALMRDWAAFLARG